MAPDSTARQLRAWLARAPQPVPLPARGNTLVRLQWLARACGEQPLSIGKLFESHCDALAILDELGLGHLAQAPGSLWGVWAAEGPAGSRVECRRGREPGELRLNGRKSWCSGAEALTQALVSVWDEAGQSRLVAVRLDAPGVEVTGEGWAAVGMRETRSVDVVFSDAPALPVGAPGAYLARPGFWHGAVGIAACWYGAARAVALPLKQRVAAMAVPDSIALMHLGAVDTALLGARRCLQAAAREIDDRPAQVGQREAQQVRLVVEAAAEAVLSHVGRALGAYPLCRVPEHAQRVADLAVFLRQSHGDRDLASLGEAVSQAEEDWLL